jgi:ribose 5-phosphate isomerase B
VRVVFGTDEVTPVTEHAKAWLEAHGHTLVATAEGAPWPDVGRDVGRAVAGGRADRGVVACWTGTGVAMAANKVPGVRAALCGDAETARGARRWNDANVLAFGLRLTSAVVVEELLDAFMGTDVDDDEVATIATVEPEASPPQIPAAGRGGHG